MVKEAETHAGEAHNIIADTAELRGTARSFDPEVRRVIEQRMRAIAAGVADPGVGAIVLRGAGRAGPRNRSCTIASRSRARTACAAPVSGSPVETTQAVSSRWSQAITQSYRPSMTSGMARSS